MAEAGADSPLESRVEDLFSNAVERQVAERRAVGRALEELGLLVKSLDDRLGRLEEAGLGSAMAVMSREVGEIRTQIDDRLTRLEAAEGARDREARDQVAGLAEQVDAFSARLHDIVAEGVEQLGRRQDENQQAIERAVLSATASLPQPKDVDVDALANVVVSRIPQAEPLDLESVAQAVVARLPQPEPLDIDEVARVVASRIPEPRPIDLAGMASALVDRMPERTAPEPLDLDVIASGLADRLPTPAEPLTLGAIASAVADRLPPPAEHLPVDVGLIAQAVVERVRDLIPTPPSTNEVASAVDASIRDGLLSVVDDIRAEVDNVRAELFSLRHEVADGVSGIPPMSARLGGDIEDLAEAVAGVRLEISRSDGERDRLREDVTQVVQGLSGDLRDSLNDVVEGRLSEVIDDKLGAMDRAEARLSELMDARVASMDEMRNELLSAVSGLREQMGSAVDQIGVVGELNTLVSEQSTRLDRLAVELPASASAAFDERAGGLASEVQGLVRELATELGSALAAVAERAEAAQEAGAAQTTSIATTVGGFEDQISAMRVSLERGSGDLAAQTTAMTAMTSDVTSMGETVGRVVGEMQSQMAIDHEAAIERLGDLLDAGEKRLQAAGDDVDVRAQEAMERLAGAITIVEGSSAGLRGELEAALDEVASVARVDAEAARDEVVAAGARLDLLFDRLAAFERSIVEHLAQRDALFSHERALIVEDLVEQLSGGLGKRERKRLAAKIDVPAARAAVAATSPTAAVPAVQTPAPGDRDLDVADRVAERAAREPDPIVPKVSATPAEPKPKARRRGRKSTATSEPKVAPKKRTAKKAVSSKPVAKKAVSSKPVAKKPVAKKSTRSTRGAAAKAPSGITRDDLIAVNGLGPAKVDALLAAFGSPAKVVAASVDDLAAVPGISAKLAKAVHDAVG